MSEESEFFYSKEREQDRKGEAVRRSTWSSIYLAAGGAILTGMLRKNAVAAVTGSVAAAIGVIGIVANLIAEKKVRDDCLDIDAMKVGLLSRHDLGKRHIVLSPDERSDLDAAMREELKILNRAAMGGGTSEKDRERALDAARGEWAKRVTARSTNACLGQENPTR